MLNSKLGLLRCMRSQLPVTSTVAPILTYAARIIPSNSSKLVNLSRGVEGTELSTRRAVTSSSATLAELSSASQHVVDTTRAQSSATSTCARSARAALTGIN